MPKLKRPRKQPPAIVRTNRLLSRLEMATALEITGGQQEMDLARLLRSNGDTATITISMLAAQVGLPYERVIRAFRDMKRLEGVVAVAQRLPKVMEDVAQDAESKEVTCSSCEGLGEVVIKRDAEGLPTETKRCIPCEGRGRVLKSGDPVARKQVLEMMELAGPRALNINAPGGQVGIFGGEASLEDVLRNARRGNGPDRTTSTIDGDQPPAGADR